MRTVDDRRWWSRSRRPRLTPAHTFLVLCGGWIPACSDAAAVWHPLDPLSEREIQSATQILDAGGLLGDSVIVSSLALREPAKGDTAPGSRQAEAVLVNRWRATVIEAVIDLDRGRVLGTRRRMDGQPPITEREMREAIRVIEREDRWTQALARRGLRGGDVRFGAYPPGVLGKAWESSGHRLLRLMPHYRSTRFPWAVPVEGLVAIVDVTNLTLIEVVDTVPRIDARPSGLSIPPLPKTSLRPLYQVQPRGTSFTVRGHEIAWQGWRLRYALHPREGLVLYDVEFGPADGPEASVLARAAIAELLVPYGHPSEAWAFRAIFDVGEFGLGRSAATLVRGEDVPANAVLLDAVLATDAGAPSVLPDVVAVFERDGGLYWRHRSEARGARELVIRFVTTVGNYDYGFSWVFAQDGTLAMEIDLTGVLMIQGGVARDDSTTGRLGTLVDSGLSAIHHQHFFTFRLDLDVGGTSNRVREINAGLLPHDALNPHGTAFVAETTLLTTERAGRRDPDPAGGRIWRIEHSDGPRSRGTPPSYELLPGPFPRLLASPGAHVTARAAFATQALWVTRYRSDERYPAGDYPSQLAAGAGLPEWTHDDEPIADTDVVLWYTIGGVHFPRPEEWPRMPVTRLRFELRPYGFVPRAEPDGSARPQ